MAFQAYMENRLLYASYNESSFSSSNTPEVKLYIACKDGNVEEVKQILMNHPNIDIDSTDRDYEQTPFCIACGNGHTEIVKILVNDERVDINKRDGDLWTPLYYACCNGHIEIVRLLLNDERIKVKKTDDDGQTPFYIACHNGHLEIVKLLLKKFDYDEVETDDSESEDEETPHSVTSLNPTTMLIFIDEKRDKVNKPNVFGQTPFYITCLKGHTEVVKLLLNDERVDINRGENLKKETPLWIACRNGHIEIVKLLFNDKRVNIRTADSSGLTPFLVACQFGRIEIVKYMLASEVKLNSELEVRIAIESAKGREKTEQSMWENGEQFQLRKKVDRNVVELLESFEKNPDQTITKLKIELGFSSG